MLPLFMLLPFGGNAQDFDLYLNGRIMDARTGDPIPYAQLRVTDRADAHFDAPVTATASGDFTRELYTSAAWEGGKYEVRFMADGYEPRTALVDASNVQGEQDIRTAWRINMDVVMLKQGQEDPLVPPMIGTCIYDSSRGTFRWQEKEARRAFPIQRYKDARILAHAALVDSVNALDGVMIHGRVLSQWNEAALEGAHVSITSTDGTDGPHLIETDRFGFYIYSLPFDKTYEVAFTKDGMIQKSFLIDLANIPVNMQEEGFSTLLDVRLFGQLQDEDLSFLLQPLSSMSYSAQEKNLVWDMEASRPKLDRLDGIVARHAATSLRRK